MEDNRRRSPFDGALCICANDKSDIITIVREYYPWRVGVDDPPSEDILHEKIGVLSEDLFGYEASKRMFLDILNKIWDRVGRFTIVRETNSINSVYQDSYTSFYSMGHFNVSRYTERLCFFCGSFENPYLCEKMLNDAFIGTLTIYPNFSKTIGSILFNPKYFVDSSACSYLLTTEYTIDVLGAKIQFRAFPHQMQDGETLRCAEVTLNNIMEYYGRTYEEYKTLLLSDILKMEDQLSIDRVLPSRGINYLTMSRIMKQCGVFPRLYSVRTFVRFDSTESDDEWQSEQMRRLMYYFVDSGIPVALNMCHPFNRQLAGHSIICIGYQDVKNAPRMGVELDESGFTIYDAADFYNQFVVIDDRQLPYAIRPYENLSIFERLCVENMLVPLHKEMYLEAYDAYKTIMSVLQNESLGIASRCKSVLKERSMVMRLVLAPSRKYRRFRMVNSSNQAEDYRRIFGEIPLPRYVWIAELFTKNEFLKVDGGALGEIVLDATAASFGINSIIMLNYPDSVCVRWPDWPIDALNRKVKTIELQPFPRYKGNLQMYISNEL